MMRIVVAALGIAFATIGAAHADNASTPDRQRAAELFEQGRKLIEAHDDVAACARFRESIKLDPEAAGTMLNLGLCNQNLKKYKTALYWYRKAQIRAHENKLPDYEQAAGERTSQITSLVASVRITFTAPQPPGTRVRIDGDEIKPDDYLRAEVDSGHHELEAGAPGKKIVHKEFEVSGEGGQVPLEITFVEGDNSIVIDPGADRRRAALFTAIGGGVLVATGGVISLYARSRYLDCVDYGTTKNVPMCTSYAPQNGAIEYANHYDAMARYWGTGLFLAGGAAIGVATYLYLTAPQKERVDRMVFAPTLGSDRLGLAMSGAF